MYGGHEAARGEAEDHSRREVVFSDSMAELEVLVEHGAERERNRLAEASALTISSRRC